MNPEQALNIVDQICANTALVRKDYQIVTQALITIKELIEQYNKLQDSTSTEE